MEESFGTLSLFSSMYTLHTDSIITHVAVKLVGRSFSITLNAL